jgi:hypothetical protein
MLTAIGGRGMKPRYEEVSVAGLFARDRKLCEFRLRQFQDFLAEA